MTGIMNLDTDKLSRIAQAALGKVANSKRWQSAIKRAESLLLDNPFWHVTEDGTLLLLSPDSSELYETDGVVCERIAGEPRVTCRAYAEGRPCKHRAAHRLLLRYGQSH
jgi:hypothetical protein